MQNLAYRTGTLASPRVRECLYYTLGRVQFPMKQSLTGDLTFYFNYDEEQGRSMP